MNKFIITLACICFLALILIAGNYFYLKFQQEKCREIFSSNDKNYVMGEGSYQEIIVQREPPASQINAIKKIK